MHMDSRKESQSRLLRCFCERRRNRREKILQRPAEDPVRLSRHSNGYPLTDLRNIKLDQLEQEGLRRHCA